MCTGCVRVIRAKSGQSTELGRGPAARDGIEANFFPANGQGGALLVVTTRIHAQREM